MKVYFSGIAGTGIGPLAEFAQDAGFEVCGSDLRQGAISEELEARKINVSYGAQDGVFLQKMINGGGVDWFVYTSALPSDHKELLLAKKSGIECSKRDRFIAELIRQKNLKLVAIAGTHGKTTTTAIIIWTLLQLGVPTSYLVGTTLGWAKSGVFNNESEYFIYEADEYDRNFLSYYPEIAAITSIDYDHADIFPTREDYRQAFAQFEKQSNHVVKDTTVDERVTLAGELRRKDASLAFEVIKMITSVADEEIIDAINRFPGVGRRFEKIADGAYSDYAHHPEEIKATIKMALEVKKRDGRAGLALIYEPHQNSRQYKIMDDYKSAFLGADKLFWLPTYLTREDPDLKILEPDDLISKLDNAGIAKAAKMDEKLKSTIRELIADNWLVVLMAAGPADDWFRSVFN